MAISLIPFSGIQFVDLEALPARGDIVYLRWNELECAERKVEPIIRDPETEALLDTHGGVVSDVEAENTVKSASLGKVAEQFGGQWLPMPYLRDGTKGPRNWVRIIIPPKDEVEKGEAPVLAFDTRIALNGPDNGEAEMPVRDDLSQQQFKLPRDPIVIAEYINTSWVRDMVLEARRLVLLEQAKGAEIRSPTADDELTTLAAYAGLISTLAPRPHNPRLEPVPRAPEVEFEDTLTKIALSDNTFRKPVDVDMVLDIGNSRTFGLLVPSGSETSQIFPLELRDLGRPWIRYEGPFPSRVEFARPTFGSDRLSRRSGRDVAFDWTSGSRVGFEAHRLARGGAGNEGESGLSSPKRYLWSDRPVRHEWRYNISAEPGVTRAAPISNGRWFEDFTVDGGVRETRSELGMVTADFGRTALMTFLLMEIFLHAYGQINSVGLRDRTGDRRTAHRLNKIVLTVPTAMSKPERELLHTRARDAVTAVWKDMPPSVPKPPEVVIRFDEATATQAVFVYNEVMSTFLGRADDFLKASQRNNTHANSSLRIASFDIGGGTSDLIITRYEIDGTSVRPEQEFREGFQLAGDDILKAVIEGHVLPSIAKYLYANSGTDAVNRLERFVSASREATALEEAAQRRFTQTVLVPLGLACLEAHREEDWLAGGDSVITVKTADILTDGAAIEVPNEPAVALDDLEIVIEDGAIDRTIQVAIETIVNCMCEAVYHYDCDYVLLAGRPSVYPAVRRLLASRMPVSPDRIIPMHEYEVGDWYPLKQNGRIGDPKTCAAVGAMLCLLTDGRTRNFSLGGSYLSVRSTARFIGQVIGGRLSETDVLFDNVDLDADDAKIPPADLVYGTPMTLGFRQIPLERWPATLLFTLEPDDHSSLEGAVLPLKLTIERIPPEEDRRGNKVFRVIEAVDASQREVGGARRPQIRLQTMISTSRHWHDSGEFNTDRMRDAI